MGDDYSLNCVIFACMYTSSFRIWAGRCSTKSSLSNSPPCGCTAVRRRSKNSFSWPAPTWWTSAEPLDYQSWLAWRAMRRDTPQSTICGIRYGDTDRRRCWCSWKKRPGRLNPIFWFGKICSGKQRSLATLSTRQLPLDHQWRQGMGRSAKPLGSREAQGDLNHRLEPPTRLFRKKIRQLLVKFFHVWYKGISIHIKSKNDLILLEITL